ncbi:MAG: tetratricopeptide repeat protein, partial [Pseudomonadota bacterium]|nr:tetratricopeptide repeat protein [Pseudomonadota bacterium]
LIAYQSGALEPAADLLFRAVKLYPDISNYTLALASILYRQGHIDEALRYYDKYPENALALSEKGFIYFEKNDLKQSRHLFNQALLKSPALPQARLGLALLSEDIPELSRLAQDTNLPDAWYYLARYHYRSGNLAPALNAIDKTGLTQPIYLIQKALIYEDMTDFDKALEMYREASLKNPHNPDIWCNQANIFKKRGEFAAAENYYKRALAQDADYIPARHNLADLLFHQKRLAESLEQYREIIMRDPNNTSALYNLAIILEKTNETAEALGLYFKLLFQDKNLPDIRWRIADNLAVLNETNPKLAQNFATGWVKNAPNDIVANHTLLALSGQTDAHMTQFAIKLFDDFALTYDAKMREIDNRTILNIQNILPAQLYLKALDIGCGTGAWGVAYKSHIGHLTGIDVSQKMLDIAQATQTYDTLICRETTQYLQNEKDAFDLITMIDVLGYISNINQLFLLIAKHLKREGLFAFSAETTDSDKMVLGPHGRYLYPFSILEIALKSADMEIIRQDDVALRKEGLGYAQGVVIVARLSQKVFQ